MIINIRLYHVISILSCIYSQPIIVCIYATPVSLLTHLNFYVIFIHNQKIKKGKNKMIDYNLIMLIGIGFIIGVFLLFIYCEHKIRQCDKELWKQQKLTESFNRHKLSGEYIKK